MLKKIFIVTILMVFMSFPMFAAKYISSDLDGHLFVTYYDAKFKEIEFVETPSYVRCEESLKGLVCIQRDIRNTRFHEIDISAADRVVVMKNPTSMYIEKYR